MTDKLHEALEEILSIEVMSPEGGHDAIAEAHRIARAALTAPSAEPVYRWNEPGIQTVHAVLCTSPNRRDAYKAQALAEEIIDALKAKGWAPPSVEAEPVPHLPPSVAQPAEVVPTVNIRYELMGRCFWHDCDRISPPMRIECDNVKIKRTLLRCTRCNAAGWYPYGSVGTVACEPENAADKFVEVEPEASVAFQYRREQVAKQMAPVYKAFEDEHPVLQGELHLLRQCTDQMSAAQYVAEFSR